MVRLAAALAVGILALAACDSGGGGSTEAFCGLAEDLRDFGDFGDNLDFTDFAAVSEEFDRLDALLDDAVDRAPDEIRDDVELVAQVAGDLFENMREPLRQLAENPQAASQDPTIFQALQEAQPTDEEQEELEDATQRIEEFVKDECGVDLDSDDNGGSSEE